MIVQRSISGLRDAMFDVLDQLRNGEITQSMARTQMEAAKAVCMTVVCEMRELEVVQKQIELEQQVQQLTDGRVIQHESR